MYVSSKGMKSTGLEDEVHVSREANRGGGQKSKQLPKIPRICKVPNMLHPIGRPPPTNDHRPGDSSASRHFSEAPERPLLVFQVLAMNLQHPDSSVCWEGAGMW